MNLFTNKTGFALFISIFIILAFSTIALLCFNLLTVQDDAAIRNLYSIRAYYLAEAARQLWLEYYVPWGSDFCNDGSDEKPNEFPDNITRTINGGTLNIHYVARQAPEQATTVQFSGSVPLSGQQISRSFTQDFSFPLGSAAFNLRRDLQNFVLATFNAGSSSCFYLGGDTGLSGQSLPLYFFAKACSDCAGSQCNEESDPQYIFRSFGNVYMGNFDVVLRIAQIGDSSNQRNLYMNIPSGSKKLHIFECSRINGNLYRRNTDLNCFPIINSGWQGMCYVYQLAGGPCPSCNSCCKDSNCDSSCFVSDAGWPASPPQPIPSKPVIDNSYFNQELKIAFQSGSTSGSPLSGDLGKRNRYFNLANLNIDGDISGGPANIVTTGRILIADNVKIGEKITLICGDDVSNTDPNEEYIYLGSDNVIGGTYSGGQISGGGSLIYSRNDSTSLTYAPLYIPDGARIKASILSPGLVWINSQDSWNIWGTVYSGSVISITGGQGELRGRIFSDAPAPDPSKDGPFNMTLYEESNLPLRLKGLYNISTSNWREQ
ncbi:MAG: hypothetical protein V1674_00170 [Candidatus Omnitrophota bacterium]